MAGLVLPPCPPSLKPIQHLLKTGTEHEGRDPVVAYWCRLAALQTGLALDKSSKVKQKPVLTHQCCGSVMLMKFSIPDPGSKRFWIPVPGSASENLSIFKPQNCFLAVENMIRDFHPGSGS
jgi:hypothetical protein